MEDERMRFIRVVEGFRRTNLFCIVPGLGQNDYAVLKAIEREMKEDSEEGIRVSELARICGCHVPLVSRSLRILEEKGLIRRTVDRKDRRNTFVSLTPEGQRAREEADCILADFTDAVFERMGKEHVHEFNSMLMNFLEMIGRELEKRNEDAKKGCAKP